MQFSIDNSVNASAFTRLLARARVCVRACVHGPPHMFLSPFVTLTTLRFLCFLGRWQFSWSLCFQKSHSQVRSAPSSLSAQHILSDQDRPRSKHLQHCGLDCECDGDVQGRLFMPCQTAQQNCWIIRRGKATAFIGLGIRKAFHWVFSPSCVCQWEAH